MAKWKQCNQEMDLSEDSKFSFTNYPKIVAIDSSTPVQPYCPTILFRYIKNGIITNIFGKLLIMF